MTYLPLPIGQATQDLIEEINRVLSETGEQQDAPSSDGLVETSSVIGQDALALSKELSRIPSHDHERQEQGMPISDQPPSTQDLGIGSSSDGSIHSDSDAKIKPCCICGVHHCNPARFPSSRTSISSCPSLGPAITLPSLSFSDHGSDRGRR
jgi:hypothetical protein